MKYKQPAPAINIGNKNTNNYKKEYKIPKKTYAEKDFEKIDDYAYEYYSNGKELLKRAFMEIDFSIYSLEKKEYNVSTENAKKFLNIMNIHKINLIHSNYKKAINTYKKLQEITNPLKNKNRSAEYYNEWAIRNIGDILMEENNFSEFFFLCFKKMNL